MKHRFTRTTGWRAIGLLALLCSATFAQARDVTIAIVDDGPESRELIPTAVLLEELENLLDGEFRVTIDPKAEMLADWTLTGARAALNRQLADPGVDIIVTTGLLGSAAAASQAQLSKPVIALMVGDIELQKYPHIEGRSGKKNFTYLYDYSGVARELQDFLDLARFQNIAVLVDEEWIEAVPAFAESLPQLETAIGTRLTIVKTQSSAAQALGSIPTDVDAVYVAPLLRFSAAEMQVLSDGLIKRKLPSFSSVGRTEIELGLLGTTSGSTVDNVVIGRRVAILAQRILLGADAGSLSVGFESKGRLLLNMRTARAIGFSPTWATLIDAELLHRIEDDQTESVGLVEAMEIAIDANLDLRIADYDVDLSREDVSLARSSLLPQLDLDAQSLRISDDVALASFSAERSNDVGLTLSQTLYADDLYAGLRISKLLAKATDNAFREATLDTLALASTSYLVLLRAQALEDVTRSNVEVTRTNLDLANVRARTGYSGRAEVLRWESEIALDRQDLAAAEAAREQAETGLKQVLNRPQSERLVTSDEGISDVLALLDSPDFQRFVDNPLDWAVFQDYYTDLALQNAPEVAALDNVVLAQDRQVTADRRRFFIPNIGLQARGERNISRSGAGSTALDAALDDTGWSVGVQMALPLFSGGALRSELSRSRYRLRQLKTERAAVAENVEARVRSALQSASGSYPAIELSLAAADAATRNLELVTDQYSRGAVSVTDLVDAQEAKLQADLGAADARYAFLIDFVEVQRAAGDFQLLLQPGLWAEWMNQLEPYFNERKTTGLER